MSPPANKDWGPVCCSKAPPHNNPHLQTKTGAPRVVQRPPSPTTTSLLLLNGSYKQRLEPRVLFLPCTASEITTTPPTPPPAAALLLLPLLLVLVLLGCCFVCIPWPANKDWGPVAVVTGGGGGSQQQREKTKKTKIYKFRDRMSNQVASLTKQDKSLYVTRGSSLCLYQQQQQQQQQPQSQLQRQQKKRKRTRLAGNNPTNTSTKRCVFNIHIHKNKNT